MSKTEDSGGGGYATHQVTSHDVLEDRKPPVLVQVLPQSTTPVMDTINIISRQQGAVVCSQQQQQQQQQQLEQQHQLITVKPASASASASTAAGTAGTAPTATSTPAVPEVTNVAAGVITVPSTVAAMPTSTLANLSSLGSILSPNSCLSLTNLLGMPSPQVGTVQLGQAGLALAPTVNTTTCQDTSNGSGNVAVVYAWPQTTSIANGVAQVIASAMGSGPPTQLSEAVDIKPDISRIVEVAPQAMSPVSSPQPSVSATESFSTPATPLSQAPESPESDHQQQQQHQSAGGGKLRTRRTLSGSKKEMKICGVCGDKALGCNFDAISCESCKAFFRRNALKPKQTKCLFEGNCPMNVNTRRFCPHCRLNKCLAIGMKPELILGEDEKKKRTVKVEANRQRRHSTTTPSTSVNVIQTVEQVFQAAVTQDSVSAPSVPPPPSEGLSQELVNATAAPQTPLSEVNLETIPDTSNLLMISKYMRLNESTIPSHLDTYLLRRLTDEENQMVQELVQVYDLSFTVDLEPLIHIKQLDPSLNQLVNQSSMTVLRLIKFAKRLEDFIRLPQECQIGILKGTWIHILLLRSVALYDTERDVWVTPRGDIPTEILKNATGFVQLHDDHVCYCKSIKQIIRDDLTIVIVLLVIVLFSPEGPHVVTREVVSNLQDKYLLLLKHYLESKYTYTRAADMFPELMSKMKELKELAEVHGKYLLDVNPREIEPIMLEILDLK